MSSAGETKDELKEMLDANSSEEDESEDTSGEEESDTEEDTEEKEEGGVEEMKKLAKKKKKKRCALVDSCKTKLGLTAYACRCGRLVSDTFIGPLHC